MEILGKLGFEPGLFAAQIVNFLVLLVIFRLFLYKPVLAMLTARKAKIAKGIEDAEAARRALTNAAIERDAMINKAAEQAEKIMEETKRMAESLRAEILNQSGREADRIIREAKENARLELVKVETQAREMTIELSKKVLDRVLSELFTQSEKETILERNIDKLEKYDYPE